MKSFCFALEELAESEKEPWIVSGKPDCFDNEQLAVKFEGCKQVC